MNSTILSRLVSGVASVVEGVSTSREVIAMTYEQLATEIRAGRHLPTETLDRAKQDRLLLEKAFGKK